MTKKRIVIAGGTGLLGRYLVQAASEYDVVVLTRSVNRNLRTAQTVQWSPESVSTANLNEINRLASILNGAHAIINLAGSSIGAGRLGPKHRRTVLESRLDSTSTLVEAFFRTRNPPKVWYQASAVGLYGDRGEELLTENAGPGSSLLSDITERWELSAQPVSKIVRLVIGRGPSFAIAPEALAWRRFLKPIKGFIGGPLGGGKQWFTWIDAHDYARAVLHLIENESSCGAYTIVAPKPVRQIKLTQMLARQLRKPAFLRVPAYGLRLILGAVADELILASTRAIPGKLLSEEFDYHFPDLGELMKKMYS